MPSAPGAGVLAKPLVCDHALAGTVRDSAALLDIAAGSLAGDLVGQPGGKRSVTSQVDQSPGRLRIAISKATQDGYTAGSACAAAVDDMASRCSDLGHEVVEVGGVWGAGGVGLLNSALMRADPQSTVERSLAQLGRELRQDDVEPFTHAMLEYAKGLRTADLVDTLSDAETTSREIARSLGEYDVLLTPTLDTTDVTAMYENGARYSAFSAVWNLTGQPAMSVPSGFDPAGLPLGAQFVAGMGQESLLLRLGAQLERAAPWPLTSGYGALPAGS